MEWYQVKRVFCILPILVIYAIIEIRRGWRVLQYGELSLSPNQRIFVQIIRLLKGDESARRAYEHSINQSHELTFYAWTSFIGGIFTLIVCFIWTITIIRDS